MRIQVNRLAFYASKIALRKRVKPRWRHAPLRRLNRIHRDQLAGAKRARGSQTGGYSKKAAGFRKKVNPAALILAN